MKRQLMAGVFACASIGLASCSDIADEAQAAPMLQFERVAADDVSHGKRVATVLACVGCHDPDLTGHSFGQPGMATVWSANLTVSRDELSDEQLAAAITHGVRPDRELWLMPSEGYSQLSEPDMAALIAFMRSLPAKGTKHPEPLFEEGGRALIENGTITTSKEAADKFGAVWPADAGAGHALGRYVARGACAHCHGNDLRGGEPDLQGNRRPDLRIAAAYDREDFRKLLQTGVAAGDRELGLMSDVARGALSSLTDTEIDALHAYLKRLAEIEP